MKNGLKKYMLMLLVLTMCSLRCAAKAPTAQHDTIYFYDTWQQMLDIQPVAFYIDPMIEVYSAYEIYFIAYNANVTNAIKNKYLAISVGDSTWLVNSRYLNKVFKGDADHFSGYIPVFFNEKVAYITYHANLSMKDILCGVSVGENGEYLFQMDYFYIDFLNHRVERVTPTYLSKLLEDYPDLKMRYEGMKDYKKRYMIEEFFLKYVDRASEDFMRPFIVDLTE